MRLELSTPMILWLLFELLSSPEAKAQEMRPGLMNVGNSPTSPAHDLEHVYAVRKILRLENIIAINNQESAREDFKAFLDSWHLRPGKNGAEVIITLRFPGTQYGLDSKVDVVPLPEDRETILQAITTFFQSFGPCIDFVTLSNEFYFGSGRCHVFQDGAWAQVSLLNDFTASHTPFTDAVDMMFEWFEDLAVAIREADSEARIYTPSIGAKSIISGHGGDLAHLRNNANDKAAYAMNQLAYLSQLKDGEGHELIEGMCVHLIVEDIMELDQAIAALRDPAAPWTENGTVNIDRVTCTEWSCAMSFFDALIASQDPTCCATFCSAFDQPICLDEWNRWIDCWWPYADVGGGKYPYSPEDFMRDALAAMDAAGFLHACRHAVNQWIDGETPCECDSGDLDSDTRFAAVALFASVSVDAEGCSPGTEPGKRTLFADAYESAAADFVPTSWRLFRPCQNR